MTTINDHHPLKLLVDHYSSWHKLRRGLSWLLKIKDVLINKNVPDKCKLTVADLESAETEIVKYGQTDIRYLTVTRKLKHDIGKQLNPHLDEQNIVKVGGRTSKAGVYYKQQTIIPSGKVAQLLVCHVHEANHMGC